MQSEHVSISSENITCFSAVSGTPRRM